MAGRDERGGNGQGRPSAVYTGHAADDELAVKLSGLARILQGEDTAQETLDAIVAAAVDTVPGAQHAGLTVVIRRREVETQAATGDIVGEVDRAQYETGERRTPSTTSLNTSACCSRPTRRWRCREPGSRSNCGTRSPSATSSARRRASSWNRHKLTADQAFALLVRASQETNTKLADIAEYLVDTGVLRARGDR
ncbi:ANTAR domain-containing protein [Microbispora rosea]|uniref:ANTAR domain-containing protein n=1 Tax=Microbispora rosea TaxID=58117 RepID=UPI00341D6012